MYSYFKSWMDRLLACVLLILLSPVMLAVSGILLVQNRGKVFFVQERPGRDEKPFYLIKFRSMNDRRDEHGKLLPDHERLTAAGRWIRSTSLDELPQLLNVLMREGVGTRLTSVKTILYIRETLYLRAFLA